MYWNNKLRPLQRINGLYGSKESKLLLKIDGFVLSYICLMYWVNYLDRLNVSNAYVSGMKVDLKMKGNEYNLINTCFTIGYTIFLVPNNLVLTKVRPKYWLTFCIVCWGVLTLSIYKTSSYKQICVIRFFQGAFESSTFVGAHLILGSWYKDRELAKRSAIFTSSGLIGNIFSSTMQSAIYTNMHNLNGIAGWRWLFIIDFIVTVPIAIYGFLLFPDVPEKTSAFYFTEEEKALAQSRLPKKPKTKLDFTLLWRVLGKWHWYFFSILWVFGGENESFATNFLLGLWLQYFHYDVSKTNHYPMGIYAVGIFSTIVSSFYVDLTGARYHWRVGIVIAVCLIISSILLLCKPLTDSFVFAAHYLSGVSYAGQAVFFAWANVVCADDLEERSVVLGSMNMFSNAVNAWWSILFYSASSAPKFRKGCWAMIATTTSSILVGLCIRFLQLRCKEPQLDDSESVKGMDYLNKTYIEAEIREVKDEE